MPRSKLTAETIRMNNNFVFYQSLGSILIAYEISKIERDEKRKTRMSRIYIKKVNQLNELFPQRSINLKTIGDMIEACQFHTIKEQNNILLTDLICNNPFFPYEIRLSENQFQDAFKKIGKYYNITGKNIENILIAKDQAIKLHNPGKLKKAIIYGVRSIFLTGMGGFIFAPAIGVVLGTAAGLSGAAVTSFALALLGGGSLAAGGMRMAGGMWLITGITKAFRAAGSAILFEMSPNILVNELVKLQIIFSLTNSENKKPYISKLKKQISLIRTKLKEDL